MVNIKKIIVTGSSSGIGNSITKTLIKNKIKVIGISRNKDKNVIKSKYFQSEEIDFSESKNIPMKIEKVLDQNEDVEGLISCAGVGYFGNIENFSVDKILSSIHTNLLSHIILTKYLVPFLKKKNRGNLFRFYNLGFSSFFSPGASYFSFLTSDSDSPFSKSSPGTPPEVWKP